MAIYIGGNYCVLSEYHKCVLPPLHKWWVLLIKFMVGPTIHVRWGVRIYGTLEVPNNFPYIGSY